MNTIKELARLVASYRWLTEERARAPVDRSGATAAVIDANLDEVFLKILRFPAEDPQISYLQIEFLVGMLGERGRDESAAPMLQDALLGHIKRLTDKIPVQPTPRALAPRYQN